MWRSSLRLLSRSPLVLWSLVLLLASSDGFLTPSAPASAANTPSRTRHDHDHQHDLRTWLSMVNVSEETSTEATDETSETEFFVVPRPPEYPPPPMTGNLQEDYETLQAEGLTVAQTLQLLQQNVDLIASQLQEKQDALAASQDEWSLEKTSLVAKIAQFTNLLQRKEEDDQENNLDKEYERERLQREVDLLQDQMNQAMNALKSEQKTAAELQLRIADVTDALEFQQTAFAKEKEGLQEMVEQEKKKLKDIQNKWEQDKSRFARERQTIRIELMDEKRRLEQAQKEWTNNQVDFEGQRQDLQRQLEEQQERLDVRTAEMNVERADFQNDRARLEKAIAQEQANLVQVQDTLQQEQARFEQVQSELTRKIEAEQKKVADLTQRLELEQKRFDSEKTLLENRIEAEHERLQQVEDRLANEQLAFAEREGQLESDLAEQVRLRQVKKKHMNRRYETIRKELTALWQGAKRDARNEKQRLTEKYDSELATMVSSVSDLTQQLSAAQTSNSELQALLKDVTSQKEKALADNTRLEDRYMRIVSERNQQIAHLQTSLDDVRRTVKEKDATIEMYQSSYRELLKLSFQVTGTKLKRSTTFVAGLFGLSNNKDEKEKE